MPRKKTKMSRGKASAERISAASLRAAVDVESTSGLLLQDLAVATEVATSDDEAPGGSTPTPDQDMVEEIGKAIGVTYAEGEPLRVGQKEEARDEHRWELDPASSEDYADRCHESDVEAVPLLKMRHEHRSRQS